MAEWVKIYSKSSIYKGHMSHLLILEIYCLLLTLKHAKYYYLKVSERCWASTIELFHENSQSPKAVSKFFKKNSIAHIQVDFKDTSEY